MAHKCHTWCGIDSGIESGDVPKNVVISNSYGKPTSAGLARDLGIDRPLAPNRARPPKAVRHDAAGVAAGDEAHAAVRYGGRRHSEAFVARCVDARANKGRRA